MISVKFIINLTILENELFYKVYFVTVTNCIRIFHVLLGSLLLNQLDVSNQEVFTVSKELLALDFLYRDNPKPLKKMTLHIGFTLQS